MLPGAPCTGKKKKNVSLAVILETRDTRIKTSGKQQEEKNDE